MRQEIIKRYTTESACCDNLSCGSNLDFLNITAGEKILDLGCGRGRETIEAARLTGPDGLAVGLDITDAMLQEASRAADEAGMTNTRFVMGDIEALPFDSNFFDAVMSNCVINHARDKAAAYREIYRVLKNGGRFVVSDAVTKSPLPDSVKNDPEAWAQCFGGAVTEQEYLKSVQEAGFEEIIILKRREYVKNNYDFISLTMMAVKYDA
ncbi:methyltransferase domain-containing protein [Oscillospiraceae bacterium WX1]